MNMPLTGRTLGPVTLDAVIGEGAMGEVYRGVHANLGIPVAVKVLKSNLHEQRDAVSLERFKREAQLAARLNHPGIVRVIDCGVYEGRPYLIMELVEGFTLADYVRRRREALDELTLLRIVMAAASALSAAHAQGIIHRDLKPANVMISKQGRLLVTDFGLARDLGSADLTRDRVVVGSPAYLAPESCTAGKKSDARSDLYSLGVIAYSLVFGRLPYDGNVQEVLQGHLSGTARYDLPTNCSGDIIDLVRRLMMRDPGRRPVDADTVVADCRRLIALRTKRLAKRGEASGTGSGSSMTDFSSLTRFLERRLGSESSEHAGGRVVHSTSRERLVVWVLLVALIGGAVWAVRNFGGHSPGAAKATAAQEAPASSEADVSSP